MTTARMIRLVLFAGLLIGALLVALSVVWIAYDVGPPVATAPPSPVPPAPPVYDAIDQVLGALRDGAVAIAAPEKAKLGKAEAVEAKLSIARSPSELLAELKVSGRQASSDLKVSDRMSATLHGGSAFDVAPSGAQTQWISAKETTTWTWMVTPKQAGDQTLILSFDALISVNGKDGVRNVNTLHWPISVEVGWPTSVTEWLDYIKKLFEGASWLWATIILPVGLFIYTRFWKTSRPKRRSDDGVLG